MEEIENVEFFRLIKNEKGGFQTKIFTMPVKEYKDMIAKENKDKVYLVMNGVKIEVKAVDIYENVVSANSINDNGEFTNTIISRRTEYRIEPLDTPNNAGNTSPANSESKVDTAEAKQATEEK